MFWINRILLVNFLLVLSTPTSIANDQLHPSYPTIPPDYAELYTHSLIADSKVNFSAYYIDKTNGYRVTTPSGTEFVVNSITQPKCAFYANYVSNDEEGHLGVSNNVAVNNSVYIGEVNFENCQ
ncbi:hypothetical protein [Thiothrix sp.]|jgi:hypothetical protein|uniref:hypothetical protein n=1 Tax=Thiothrix sp. TaxID=1032 RepID=UPI00257B708B|nr:hypothetical protein [Thiothrix sp.]